MSPASGDLFRYSWKRCSHRVSIQLMSPASGDIFVPKIYKSYIEVSIQLMSPASGDLDYRCEILGVKPKRFPFN